MVIYLIIILAVASRFIPHLPNVGLITALAMFSAANMDWKKAAGVTLAARFISDIYLGFFAWPLMVAVYASHLVGILFGVWIKNSTSPRPSPYEGRVPAGRERLQYRVAKIIVSSLGASAIFFLVTNFAFFYAEYPHNFAGVMLAYANGLPFLRGTLVGDLGYVVALFGGLAIVQNFSSFKSYILHPKS